MGLILVIDDSDFQRSIIKGTLTATGHTVAEATNGEEGLASIENLHPDCIVMDYLMPKITGMQLLEEMQKKGIKIPTIMLTADIQLTTKEKCEALGAYAILNKPFKRPELLAIIEKIFSEKEK